MLTRKTTLLLKVESVPGTFQSDIAAADGMLAYEPAGSPDISMFKRDPYRAHISRLKSLSGTRAASITFKVEIKGSGTAGTAPDWAPALIACGFAETLVALTSATYKPTSGNGLLAPCSIEIYEDGGLKQFAGCMGSVKLVGAVGEPMFLEFTFRGKIYAITADTLITPTVDSTVPPVLLNAAFATNLGGSESHIISSFEIDMQNEVNLRPSVNDEVGYDYAQIVGRNPVGSMDPEYSTTYDWLAKITEDTEGTLTLTLGSVSGNIITTTAPKLRFLGMDPADRGGIRTLTVPFELNASSGNDEISIVLS